MKQLTLHGKTIDLPSAIAKLPRDERGYPIPYFVPTVDGKPDFRLMDSRRRHYCMEKKRCMICGGKLHENIYFVSGPKGLINGISSDPGMHRDCAEFSLQACPHLLFPKAQRRETHMPEKASGSAGMVCEKPDTMYLVLTKKYRIIVPPDRVPLLKFTPVYSWKYDYSSGNLAPKI